MTQSPIWLAVRRIPKETFGGHGRHTRKLVLAMLASHADPDGSHCFPSLRTLSQDCGLTERGTQKVMAWLRQNGFLNIAYRAGPKDANLYTIVIPEVVNAGRGEQSSWCPEDHGVVNKRSPNQPIHQPLTNQDSSAVDDRAETKTHVRRKNPSPQGKPAKAVDSRSGLFREFFTRYYQQQVGTDPDWDGQEGAALSKFLKANPKITPDDWQRILANRVLSPGLPHGDRLSAWIGRAKNWLNGPTKNKWGDPLSGGSSKPSPKPTHEKDYTAGLTEREDGTWKM